jgi:Domain of unknown function (DUF4595) with porin-like fold
MNKNYFLGASLYKVLMLTLSVLIWAGCKKDKEIQPPVDPVCNITKIVINEEANQEGLNIKYDSNNRVSVVNPIGETYNITMSYAQNKVTISNPDDGLALSYNLDKGRISTYTEDGSNYSISYTYDTDGYLIAAEENNYGTIFNYSLTYQDGNLTKINKTGTFNGITQTSETVIKYSDEPAFNFLGFVDPLSAVGEIEYYLSGYFGKASKNRVTKVIETKTTSDSNNKIILTSDYTYEKNSEGKITVVSDAINSYSQTGNNNPILDPGGYVNKYSLTYTCH